MIRLRCRACGVRIEAPRREIAKDGKCPVCGAAVAVPRAGSPMATGLAAGVCLLGGLGFGGMLWLAAGPVPGLLGLGLGLLAAILIGVMR
jgi:hypothetical protein